MTKKDREYNIIVPLMEEYGFTLIDRKDNERPDFVVINQDGIVVGIEVTSVSDNSKLQIAATEKAIDELFKDYSSQHKGAPNTLITVKVNDDLIHNGVKIKEIKKRIYNELDTIVSDKSKDGEFIQYVCDYPSSCFSVSRAPGLFTYLTALPLEILQNTIEAKNMKLKQYAELPQNSCIREYWLVINTPMKEGWDFSSYQGLTFKTGYSRIYLTDPFSMNRLV